MRWLIPTPLAFAMEYTNTAMNLRFYYPNFVAVAENGMHWLLATKGQETADVRFKDPAAERSCSDAGELTSTPWRYLKIPQKDFEVLRPRTLADLSPLGAARSAGGAV